MAIKTLVVWPLDTAHSTETTAALATKISSAMSAGLTSGYFFNVDGVTKRTWKTTESAQDFVDFLNTLESPPLSAEVVEE